jgi:hypothetical protein
MARTEMTLRDLINNPPGSNSRQIAARYTIRDALRAKFVAAMADPARRRRFKMSLSGTGGQYVVWVKVPSEKYAVDYDVILQLSFPEGARTVTSADVKVYCNSPSFVFSLGYAFNQAGFLADGWDGALGEAADSPSSITNPHADVGFDKVVQQAVLFATGPGGLVSVRDVESGLRGVPPNPKDASLSAQSKLLEYRRAKEKFDAANRILKRAEKRTKEEAEKKAKATARASKGAAKLAKTSATAKKARQAGNAVGKKSRSIK